MIILLLIVSDVKCFMQKWYRPSLIFFDHMDLQIIKVNLLDEIILIKMRFGVAFKLRNGGIQPDWLAKVKLITDFIQSAKNLVRACICAVITDYGIF